jgi:hypothetical protein
MWEFLLSPPECWFFLSFLLWVATLVAATLSPRGDDRRVAQTPPAGCCGFRQVARGFPECEDAGALFPVRELYASCSAAYTAKFASAIQRIRQ